MNFLRIGANVTSYSGNLLNDIGKCSCWIWLMLMLRFAGLGFVGARNSRAAPRPAQLVGAFTTRMGAPSRKASAFSML